MSSARPLLISMACFSLLASVQLSGCAVRRGDEARDILYLAVGASDALGIGASPLRNGYVFRIRDELEKQSRRDVRLVNLGIPAATTRDLRQSVQLALRREIKPDLVTVWTGANDITSGQRPEDFEGELKILLQELRDKTSAFIVIGDIPDLTKAPRFRAQPSRVVTSERIAAFNRVIAKQAGAFNVPVVTLSREQIADDLVSDVDGFHPSDKGHSIIAQLFLKVILPRFLS
ncbi:MAG TPA: SGNH/GDSL hydrolase family protein [Candidatus Binatia bacterium]|nr:SGNH/GDSL hydrolase family protein [Candidatus Binatia bacterium]